MDCSRLEATLQYKFKNASLLMQALTHPSAVLDAGKRQIYERLEFIGDAVLELAVSRRLFDLLPDCDEGTLTKLRARIVSREHLSRMAMAMDMQAYLVLGKGEERSGGRMRPSILANTFESVIGAVLLDSDYETACTISLLLLEPSIAAASSDLQEINPKGELQALLQKLQPVSPVYAAVEIPHAEHPHYFSAVVTWQGVQLGAGQGSSKRKAEVSAAIDALNKKLWLQA